MVARGDRGHMGDMVYVGTRLTGLTVATVGFYCPQLKMGSLTSGLACSYASTSKNAFLGLPLYFFHSSNIVWFTFEISQS